MQVIQMPSQPHTLLQPVCARLAVLIGSGGVRSIAGLGLVAVLRREGLAPDAVVGCSAGAILGALVAAGHATDQAVAMGIWAPPRCRVAAVAAS
jgi:NTE family protein